MPIIRVFKVALVFSAKSIALNNALIDFSFEDSGVMLEGPSASRKLSWSRSCEMLVASVCCDACGLRVCLVLALPVTPLWYLLLCLPLVDGHWNEWSAWSTCSASCSNGTMQRTRECNGPSYGGSECHGSWKETANCFLKDCPGKNETEFPYLGFTIQI